MGVSASVMPGHTRSWLVAAPLCAVLGACAGGTLASTPTLAPPSPSPAPAPTGASPVDAYLPKMLNGIEAHRFAVGTDMLARLAVELSAAPDDLEVAFASDHGASFVQTYAVRAAGRQPGELLEAFPAVAYDPSGGGTTATRTESIEGHEVLVVENAASAGRIGTYYVMTVDDVLVVVQAFDRAVAAAAVAAMPFPGG